MSPIRMVIKKFKQHKQILTSLTQFIKMGLDMFYKLEKKRILSEEDPNKSDKKKKKKKKTSSKKKKNQKLLKEVENKFQ